MKTTDNTILITGGGSGIGRGLAEAFHALGNQVIISGRGQKTLDETTAANPGMKSLTVDMTDASSIRRFARQLEETAPSLNVLINNAGIMVPEDLLTQPADSDTAENTILTNLLGPIRLTGELLPHLRKQPHATVINVTSGLAFIPLAMAPTYCATKAAVHSYTESLRHQLRETNVEVLELAPPYVATHLMGDQQASDPRAMPLEEFITEVMDILTTQPSAAEVLVKRVEPLRFSMVGGPEKYAEIFQGLNSMQH
ncbi:SDR family oxidoreductase [Luteolibacter yonseiensis]|uniref:SDR family oxidoreductase n=1 Tax=Luteolibacter yonseiensis TaxID=1144680 RepID=A0A934R7T9_9BACT|nr:SDR family oxidoreductase [Luteolibacter yonseiensis]MBK1817892.1 SDR family oxidoreductase [Luteolibacter yonseiensis]